VVSVIEHDAAAGETIDVGGPTNGVAVARKSFGRLVVGQDEQEVGSTGGVGWRCGNRNEKDDGAEQCEWKP
jgi:hypothetical protein